MSFPERYKVDHLFLLVGTNPLPNYVAAQLLVRDPQRSQVWLVYSTGTNLVRGALEEELKKLGFKQPTNILVEEANPQHIRNQIRNQATKLTGVVGLNYTGGTKAMSVHAYLALDELTRHDPHHLSLDTLPYVQYSYLDAHTLSMVFTDSHNGSLPPERVGRICVLTVEQMVRLHSRNVSLKETLFWPHVAQALLQRHSSGEGAAVWQSWIAGTFFLDPPWPQTPLSDDEWRGWIRTTFVEQQFDRRKWTKKAQLKTVKFSLPDDLADIATAFAEELADPQPATLDELWQQGSFRDPEKLGKWLEGEWLETAVMQAVQAIRDQGQVQIDNLVRDVQTKVTITTTDGKRVEQQVQIDVAFTRGYQLFVLSCSTSEDKGLCKSKLLEAAVRAEQIGGAEARVCLICCYKSPLDLEKEVADVLGKRLRVFGRAHLLNLQERLADWIAEVSPE